MAHWERVHVSPDFTGITAADRRGGSYLRYHPDPLAPVGRELDAEVLEHAAGVTTALAQLGERLRANPLPILYSTLIRSESISSSWIEGIRETPRAIAIAQIGEDAATHGASQIVRNVEAMREAVEILGRGAWEHDDIHRIHHDLLPWHPVGYRTDQVWIGGTTKLNAAYAAPPAEKVEAYVADLISYANTSGDLPVVQAAVVHAQFETIHPFSDGNGRVGRALFHGVLKRAGLVDAGVIPLSTALRNDERGYVAALTAFRYDGDDRREALNSYVGKFLGYVETAVVVAERFREAAIAVHDRWRAAVVGLRKDAAIHRAINLVVEHPVISARFVAERLDLSAVAAHNVINQLESTGVIKSATGKYRRSALYQADDILNLLQFGAEAGPRSSLPVMTPAESVIVRCGATTTTGPCGNRVPARGQRCWRHRG